MSTCNNCSKECGGPGDNEAFALEVNYSKVNNLKGLKGSYRLLCSAKCLRETLSKDIETISAAFG